MRGDDIHTILEREEEKEEEEKKTSRECEKKKRGCCEQDVVLDDEDAVGAERGARAREEGDEVVVGEVADAPLQPDDVVLARSRAPRLHGDAHEATARSRLLAADGARGADALGRDKVGRRAHERRRLLDHVHARRAAPVVSTHRYRFAFRSP